MQLRITDRTVDLFEEPIDLTLRVTDTPPPGSMGRPPATLRHVICASPRYLAERGHPQHPRILEHHACITLGETSATGIGALSARAKPPRWPCAAAMWPTTARCGWRPR